MPFSRTDLLDPVQDRPDVPPVLTVRGLTRRFGGVTALDRVDFDLRAGEIHALLGANGAGKSTLINVLGGIVRPDAGTIEMHGRRVELPDVASALRLGIRLIHQELSLAPNLSVADNILLGREPTRLGFFLDRRRQAALAQELVDDLGLGELGPVGARIAGQSTARQQLVEIARALAVRAQVLVLDEPTASLSQAEAESLFARLRGLRAQGVGIIYISHRLEEIRRLADRITVLRDGRRAGTWLAAEIDREVLVGLMVGPDVESQVTRPAWNPGEVVLSVSGLRSRYVRGVSFELRSGEVLGLAGLVGSGRSRLVRALCGIDPIDAGNVVVAGRPVSCKSPAQARAAGIVLVPEDRKRQGLVMTGSLAFNLALPWTGDWIKGLWIDRRRRAAIVARAIRRFAIKTDDPEQAIDRLSGGNQQKAVVARWMEHPPRVLILDEPTRGVDVKARSDMFGMLHHLVAAGIAVLLISSDLPELTGLSHRLLLYRDGRILREVPSSETTSLEVMAELMRR
jgi:ABC-type sugar transport system ATPase subunit